MKTEVPELADRIRAAKVLELSAGAYRAYKRPKPEDDMKAKACERVAAFILAVDLDAKGVAE